MERIFHVLFILVLCAHGNSAYVRSYANNAVFDAATGLSFSWNFSSTTLSAGFRANANGWVAIGVSTVSPGKMKNADILMGFFDRQNRGFLNDYWSDSQNTPTRDTVQDLSAVASGKSGGVISFEFDRPFQNPPNAQDLFWNPCVPLPFIWAVDVSQIPTNADVFTKHSSSGALSLTLCTNCVAPSQCAPPQSPSFGTTWVALIWSPPATLGGAPLSYRLKVDDGASGSYNIIYDGPNTSFNATGLLAGASYRFVVQAYNCIGAAQDSSPLSRSTMQSVPARPDAPILQSATNVSLTLGWIAPPSGGQPILKYSLYAAPSTSPSSWTLIYEGLSLSYTYSGLQELTQYSFRLAAFNSLGSSPNSTSAVFSTASSSATAPSTPAAPSIINVTQSSVLVSWTAPADGGSPIIDYSLYFTSTSDLVTRLAYRGPSLSRSVSGLTPASSFNVFLSARNSVGTSRNSSSTSVQTPAVPAPIAEPSIPIIVSAPLAAVPYNSTVEALAGRIAISWAVLNDSISIKLVCQCTGWVGIGLGATMAPATDIIMGRVINGQVYLNDYWSTSQGEPSLDTKLSGTEDILAFSGSEVNGVTTIEFIRGFSTTDASHDGRITQGVNDVIVAFHPTDDNLGFHEQWREALKIDFFAGTAGVSGAATSSQPLRISHGALMFIGWGIMLPFGILFARYAKGTSIEKKLPAAWFMVHRLVQIIGYAVALVGLIIAFVMVQRHFATVWHAQIGIAVMIMGVLQIIVAFLRPHPPPKGEKKKLVRLIWEWKHILLGRTAALLAIPTMFSGLLQLPASTVIVVLYAILVAVTVVLIVIMEVRRVLALKKNDAETREESLKPLN